MKSNKIPPIQLNVTPENYQELINTINRLEAINAISEIECAIITTRLLNIYIDKTMLATS